MGTNQVRAACVGGNLRTASTDVRVGLAPLRASRPVHALRDAVSDLSDTGFSPFRVRNSLTLGFGALYARVP